MIITTRAVFVLCMDLHFEFVVCEFAFYGHMLYFSLGLLFVDSGGLN